MEHDWGNAPDIADIEAMAHRTIEALPAAFRAEAAKVVLRVENFAADRVLKELDIPDAYSLTGLYDGVPLTEKSVASQETQPDVIWLFRGAILDEWIARGNVRLSELVAHVYVHELAHHFGWSDDDIATIDRWWE